MFQKKYDKIRHVPKIFGKTWKNKKKSKPRTNSYSAWLRKKPQRVSPSPRRLELEESPSPARHRLASPHNGQTWQRYGAFHGTHPGKTIENHGKMEVYPLVMTNIAIEHG